MESDIYMYIHDTGLFVQHTILYQACTQDFEKGGYEGSTCKTTPTFNDHAHSYVIVNGM